MKLDESQSNNTIRESLEALPGVLTVDVDEARSSGVVHTDAEGLEALATAALGELVRRETGQPAQIELRLTGGGERRARFLSLQVKPTAPGSVRATTVLEWHGEHFEGNADDETSRAGEIRACVNATIQAVERFIGDKVKFTLIGAKEVHVFDHDLIAVLVHSDQHPDRRLIGTSLIVNDRQRSAALAVLNATNRVVAG